MSFGKTICVDFDGTIVDFDFPRCGPLKTGVKEALQRFRDLGYHITIYSCRTCSHFPEVFLKPGEVCGMDRDCVRDMIRVLNEAAIPYDEIDDGTKGKPLAQFYIDDRVYASQTIGTRSATSSPVSVPYRGGI